MTDLTLLDARTCLFLGGKHTAHLPRVLIEDNAVKIRTRCGLDPLTNGFTETHAVPTCQTCVDDERAGQ